MNEVRVRLGSVVAQNGWRPSLSFPRADLSHGLCEEYAERRVAVQDRDADMYFRGLTVGCRKTPTRSFVQQGTKRLEANTYGGIVNYAMTLTAQIQRGIPLRPKNHLRFIYLSLKRLPTMTFGRRALGSGPVKSLALGVAA